MSKKMKILIAVLVAILTLTVSGTVAVLAQENEEPEPEETLVEELEDIMAERGEQAFDELLDRAVEEGLITEGEAAEIADWWEQKPEAFNRTMLKKAFSGMCQNPDGLTDEACGQFKEMRRNTWQWRQGTGAVEGSAGETRAWKGSKPAALNQTSAQPRAMPAVRGRQMIAVAEGWQGLQQCQAD